MSAAKSPASTGLEHGPVFSWHRRHRGLVFTSGHAAVDVDDMALRPGTFEQEVRSTLENLGRTLSNAGSSLEQVLMVTVYLTDMANFPRFNQVYAEFFPGNAPPARTCVEVRRLPYHFQVEIQAVAASDEG
ncbi:MAG: RidA family protein [Myxococcota bacterium]